MLVVVVVFDIDVTVVVDVVAVEEAAEAVGFERVAVRIVGEMAAERYVDRLWTALPLAPQMYP